MGAVVVVAVPRAGRAVAGAPGGFGDVSSVRREEQGLLSPSGEGWLRGREGAQEAPPAPCPHLTHRCAAPRGSPALPGTVTLPHPTDMELPFAPVHGVTLSPQRAEPGIPSVCPWPTLSRFCAPHRSHSHPPARHSRWMTMPSRRAMRKIRMMLIRATQSQVNLQSARNLQPTCPQSCWPGGEDNGQSRGAAEPNPHLPARLPQPRLGTSPLLVPAALMCPQGVPEPTTRSCSPTDSGVCTNPQAGTEAVPAWCGAGPILVWFHARCRPGLLALKNGVAELGL